MSVVGITTKENKEQAEEVRLIMDNQHPIVCVTGNAGTGKTFIAIATALQLQRDKRYSTILYGRNPVQLGEGIGYLKGTEEEKLQGFMSPLADNAKQIERIGKSIKASEIMMKVEMVPLYSLRGRTFEDCVIIVDECQNLTVTELKTIMTRVGRFCKLILIGSMNQIDAKKQDKKHCDFERVIEKLEDIQMPEFAHIHLVQSMRAPWCTFLDDVLSELEEK